MRARALAFIICGYGMVCFGGLARAQEAGGEAPATDATATIVKPAPKPPGRYFVHANFAFNVYTYLSAMGDGMGPRAATHLTPANRAIIFEQVGFGYYVHPKLRLQLTMQIGETLTGLPDGKSPVALLAFLPLAVFTHKGFVLGVGPQFAPISANTVPRVDGGLFAVTGYTFKLPKGFSLGGLVQGSFLFRDRVTAAISPAVIVANRF
jgi:hypothetical protein